MRDRRASWPASTCASSGIHHDTALEVPFSGDLVDRMVDVAARRGPGRAPCCRTRCRAARTTSRSSRLGIRGYGFAPLRLPADLDFAGMFHGVDERVPTDALRFGTRVLDRLLRDLLTRGPR